MDRRLEADQPALAVGRFAHHLEGEQVVLELAYLGVAAAMLGVEAIEDVAQGGAALAHPRKQQIAFLGVMYFFRKLVDVEQHRAQYREVGRPPVSAAFRQEQTDRAQYRGQRAVLVADDAQRGMGGHGCKCPASVRRRLERGASPRSRGMDVGALTAPPPQWWRPQGRYRDPACRA